MVGFDVGHGQASACWLAKPGVADPRRALPVMETTTVAPAITDTPA